MASETIGDLSNGLSSRERVQWTKNSKVYTRRFHKKTQKLSANNDTAAADATTSASEEVLVAVTEVLNSRTTEIKNDSVTAFSMATTADGSAAATTNHENLETIEAEDVNFSPQRLQERPLHREQTPPPTLECQLEEQPQHVKQLPSLQEDSALIQKRVQEGSESLAADQQNLSVSSPPSSGNDLQNLKESSTVPSGNGTENLVEALRSTIENSSQDLRASLPLPSADELPNGREVSPEQLLRGNEPQNDRELITEPRPPIRNGPVNVNGIVKPLEITRVHDRVRYNLSKLTPKNEVRELRQQLQSELDQIRRLVEKLGAKHLQLADDNTNININSNGTYMAAAGGNLGQYTQSLPKNVVNDAVERRALVRVHSEVGSVGNPESRLIGLTRVNSDIGAVRRQEPRLYNRQLSVTVMENHHGANDCVEKEKRTPKANKYYRNSEFLLGKDRLPPESNKRLKTSNGRNHGRETEHAFGSGFGFGKNRNQVLRSCSNLLQRLMKHKHGWVFNEPVDAKALGLHDYHDIIKRPMDLGTIKDRLSQNWYKSPREFAEDVRLVFHNAMTYNPKGQDVHVMAEQLAQIFEERWAVIETEYNPNWRYQMYQAAGLPSPISGKVPPQSNFAPALAFVPAPFAAPIPSHIPPAPQMRTLDGSVSMPTPMSIDPKMQRPHSVRTSIPKKPKAKDPNKRDMSYEEKQRLSTNLQSLPSEKLDDIVQIIKKRDTMLSQHDGEIEVDIDHVDPETLWELDRFVSNYKKNLSKRKRKAELALQARAEATGTTPMMRITPGVPDVHKESGSGADKSFSPPSGAQGEKQGCNASRSSNSSSSSSDSGSSSSDSDSDSSSADGSDAGQSPRT
ncbi:transcription factor GTE4-like [Olea europaea var. sylvestris]|uniref:Transcription factor GTE4-like n=1 Tax=Olea europaea subsp. europaea TaxID=158383 RepID=A0A8S0VJI6_OLEEU|nr:transcription factor GTE4-like [Olea europaea var. sylvestris]CAA3032387.1 transcription factor GTE4-like [Olea europaea subsp. europaea]